MPLHLFRSLALKTSLKIKALNADFIILVSIVVALDMQICFLSVISESVDQNQKAIFALPGAAAFVELQSCISRQNRFYTSSATTGFNNAAVIYRGRNGCIWEMRSFILGVFFGKHALTSVFCKLASVVNFIVVVVTS